MSDDFSTELEAWLDETSDHHEVARILKKTASERTEVVYRRTGGSERIGPFVRKVFMGDHLGRAYERIYHAQVSGKRFEHQPVIYACEHTGDRLEVVMEYIHGMTLHDAAIHDGPGLSLARRVFPALCAALTELHDVLDDPIIHRDVKPSNVMLDGERVVLIDLGIARTWHEGAPRDTVRYGTPGYAPPEQFGYGQTGVRSDIYALGMVLAFCLIGMDPSPAMRENGFDDVRIPTALRPILIRATAFDPSARYATASEVAHAFDAAVETRAGTTPEPSPPQPTRFTLVGKVWNALLAIVWGLLVTISVIVTISPSPESSVAQYPLWFRPIVYMAFVIVPTGCLAYLVMDKRRLRQYPLFSKRPRINEFLMCLGITLGWVFLAVILYYVAGQPRSNS